MNSVPNRVPWINLAIGILTIITPYALAGTNATKWSLTVVGIIIAIVAIIELAMDSRNRGVASWPVVNLLLGIWLLISTSLAGGNPGVVWADIVLGIVAIVTAIVSLSYERIHAATSPPPNLTHRV